MPLVQRLKLFSIYTKIINIISKLNYIQFYMIYVLTNAIILSKFNLNTTNADGCAFIWCELNELTKLIDTIYQKSRNFITKFFLIFSLSLQKYRLRLTRTHTHTHTNIYTKEIWKYWSNKENGVLTSFLYCAIIIRYYRKKKKRKLTVL